MSDSTSTSSKSTRRGTQLLSSTPRRRSTAELRAWKYELEEEAHNLERASRRFRGAAEGKKKLEEDLEEVNLNLKIAFIDLRFEAEDLGPNSKIAGAKELAKEFDKDHKIACLRLDLFHQKKASGPTPTEEQAKAIEALKRQIDELDV